MFDVKRIEGRRFHPGVKFWSVPASLRAWKKLEQLDFTMLQFGGGPRHVEWLKEGCPVGYGIEDANDLFPYQRQGVMRLLTRAKMVLADDPGLGKTWQAIEWARRKQHRKLVVAPKVVLGQWREAIYQRYKAVPRPSWAPDGWNELPTIRLRAPSWGGGEWNIVNYEFLPKLLRVDGDFDLIVDEAHLCTNTKAARTKTVLKLCSSASRVVLLTGTPPARPAKLWPFFVACNERSAKEFFPYALRYCGAERNDFGWDFSGATHLDELRDETKHFMLRRTKAEVLTELPPVIHTSLNVLSPESGEEPKKGTALQNQITKLDDVVLDMASRGHSLTSGVGLGEVQRLRALTSKQKIPTTVEYVELQGDHRVVVFCYFRETMDTLVQELNSKDSEPLFVMQIHGDTTPSEREDILSWFKSAERAVIVLQSGIGGLGLDGLQVASTGIIHDLPWTSDEMKQIISRLHRQGQPDSVNMVTVQSTSKVEAQMLQAIRAGKELHEVMYGRP